MKLKLQEWNDITDALKIATRVLNEEGQNYDRTIESQKELSDRAFAQGHRYEQLYRKIGSEGMQ